MARTITATVGSKAPNRHDDVVTIQELLNNIESSKGGPNPLLVVDGLCGSKTTSAIQKFQLQHFGWKGADSRVEPEKQTLAKLNELQPVIPPPPPVTPPAPRHTHFMLRQPGKAGTTMTDPVDFFMEVNAGVNNDPTQPNSFSIVEHALFWLGTPSGHKLIVAKPQFRTGGGVPASFFKIATPGITLQELDCTAVYVTTGQSSGGLRSRLSLFFKVIGPGQRTGASVDMRRHLFEATGNDSGVSMSVAGQFQFVRNLP